MASVPAAYTARKGLIMKRMVEANVRMLQTLLRDAYTKLVACFVLRACSITACQTLKGISLTLVHVTQAMTSSAYDGLPLSLCPSLHHVCAAISPCEHATTVARSVDVVEESIKLQDEPA